MGIKENIETIRSQIENAVSLSGRNAKDIILLGATKMQSAETVREAIGCGLDAVGENRVQELREKLEAGAYGDKPLHFIGALQSNKAKYIVGICDLIHSLDSIDLAVEIDRQAKKKSIIQNVLIEVNIGIEESKGGIEPEHLKSFIESISTFKGVMICGLMAIPPRNIQPEQNRSYFKQMNALFEDAKAWESENCKMKYLSMGMSGDYVEAILEGANIIRIGTGIFGQRT